MDNTFLSGLNSVTLPTSSKWHTTASSSLHGLLPICSQKLLTSSAHEAKNVRRRVFEARCFSDTGQSALASMYPGPVPSCVMWPIPVVRFPMFSVQLAED